MDLRGRKLPSLGLREEGKNVFRGKVENIGVGGICLLSDRSIPLSSLVRCEIVVPGTFVPIPTLMQVRWAQKRPNKIGLQFLF
jgi:PilZ domain-containing protein